MDLKSLELMSRQHLRKAQKDDETIRPTFQALKDGRWPEASRNTDLLRMKREVGKFSMKDGLLHRNSKKLTGEVVIQLVLPAELRERVMRAMHDDLGHLGQERTIDLIRSRFFWPKMSLDVEEYI